MASNGDVEISQDTVIVLAVVIPVFVALVVILYLICTGCCDSEHKSSEGNADDGNSGGILNGDNNNRGLSNVAAPTEKTALLASKPKIGTPATTTEPATNDVEQQPAVNPSKSWTSMLFPSSPKPNPNPTTVPSSSSSSSSSSISLPNTTTEIEKEANTDVEQPIDSKSWASLSSIDFLNPMDLLGITGGTPIVWPSLPEGPEQAQTQALLTKNNPVLFDIYLFYAFHADTVRDARVTGKAKAATTVDSEAYRAAIMSPNPCDQPLLSHANLQDLLKDFKLLSGSVTVPWLNKELTKEDKDLLSKEDKDLLSYRRFVGVLMKVGEELKPKAPRDKSLLNVIETMDCSEQLYVMQETGQMHNNNVQFVTDTSN